MEKRLGLAIITAAIFTLTLSSFLAPPPAAAQTEPRVVDGYASCLRAAALGKNAEQNPSASPAAIAACRLRYPAAQELIACKKAALAYHEDPKASAAAAKSSDANLKAALAECQKDYLRLAFDPSRPLPFARRGKQIYFAGGALEASLAYAPVGVGAKGKEGKELKSKEGNETKTKVGLSEDFGPFDCTDLVSAQEGMKPYEYVLFANDLRLYKPLSQVKTEVLAALFGLKPLYSALAASKKRAEGKGSAKTAGKASKKEGKETKDSKAEKPLPSMVKHPVFGEIFLDAKTAQPYHYFPLATCTLKSLAGKVASPTTAEPSKLPKKPKGSLFEAVDMYYLSDRLSRGQGQSSPSDTLIAYAGVSFYQPQLAPEIKALLPMVLRELGPKFTAEKIKAQTYFISESKVPHRDPEGDPKNLCDPKLKDKEDGYVGLVRTGADETRAQYLAVANIKALCQHGDRMADALLRRQSSP